MAVHCTDGLDGNAAVVEVPAECPPEGVVGELQSEPLPDLVDYRAVEAMASLGVFAACGLVLVVAPDQECSRVHPERVVCSDPCDELRTFLQPCLEHFLAVRVERQCPPLPDTAALSEDCDVALGRIPVDVDVLEHQVADLGYTEAHAQFEVDGHHLGGCEVLTAEKKVAFLVGKPVHVRPGVVPEFDVHVLDDGVLVVREIAVHDMEIPLLGGDREVVPEPQEEVDRVLVYLSGVGLLPVLL